MKKLLLLAMAVVLVGCGKKVAVVDLDNEMIKKAMQWDADIKILKLEVEHLKADVKRLQEDNNLPDSEGVTIGEPTVDPPAKPKK